jgi:heme A synthase
MNMKSSRYATFAWVTLGINILVIIWGAYVRATGSGAGCGSNWPLCQGELVPKSPGLETVIEFSHRISSGVALIAVAILFIWALRVYPRGNRTRRAAIATMIFMIIEALVGAGLVLLEYTASNVSIARAYWMAGHLINTFLLLGALTLTAWWASGGPSVRLRRQGAVNWLLLLSIVGMMVLGASGAVTALGDTLVLTAGISPEDSSTVATLVDLRIYHPIIAILVGALVVGTAWFAAGKRADLTTRRFAQVITALYAMQLVLGALNVALKAPVWLQLLHLLMTSSIWIMLVLLCASALSTDSAVIEQDGDIGSLKAQPDTTA